MSGSNKIVETLKLFVTCASKTEPGFQFICQNLLTADGAGKIADIWFDKVEAIPMLQVKMSVLKEEKRLLMLKLKEQI